MLKQYKNNNIEKPSLGKNKLFFQKNIKSKYPTVTINLHLFSIVHWIYYGNLIFFQFRKRRFILRLCLKMVKCASDLILFSYCLINGSMNIYMYIYITCLSSPDKI